MPIRVSRRQWLMATMLGVAAVRTARADGPDRLAANAAGGEWLPPISRSIQLPHSGNQPPVVTAIAVDPRGEWVAAAGDDHSIRILTTATLAPVRSLAGHRDRVRTMAFDPSGNRLVSAGNDGQLILWDRNRSFRVEQRMSGTPALACARFSPDGNEIAAVGFSSQVFLIGPANAKPPVLRCEGSDLRAVAYRDDGQLLVAGGRSGELQLFDFVNGFQSSHPIHEGRIHGTAFHYNSHRAVSVGEDGQLTVFDTQNQRLVHRVAVTTGKLFAVTVLNSQLVAVAGSDDVIRIVNTDDGIVVRQLEGHTGSVSSLGSGGGLLFSGSFDTTLRRWVIAEIETGGQRIAEKDPRIDR